MRQVKSQALRTGVNQDWGMSAYASPVRRTAKLYIKQALKQVSRYPVSISRQQTPKGVTVSTVFYKYIQRARYRRSVLFLVRSAALKGRSPEAKVMAAQTYGFSFKRLHVVQSALEALCGSSVSLSIHNVYAVVDGTMRVDLLSIQRYYVFNRFKNLMYLMDLVQTTQLAVRFGSGSLFADAFSKGLIRNRRKGQRRFLRLAQAVITHARDTTQVQYRPDGWRLELFGKVDGQLRAKRHLLKFGNVSYQKSSQPLNYVQRTVATKFGTFGLKLWMRLNEYNATAANSWRRGFFRSKRPAVVQFSARPKRRNPAFRRVSEVRSEQLTYRQPKIRQRVFGRRKSSKH
jgi:hypothetical protein